MDKSLIQTLGNLGLTDKEAKVYISLIEIGTNVVSRIAEKARINRVTTYDILEKLKEKGFISSFTKQKIKYFTATDPEIVASNFDQKNRAFKDSLPELKRLKGETAHPRIQYFEGLEGIKAIYEDTLNAKTEILNFSNSEEIRKIWPTYDKDYVEKRAKKKIYLKGVIPSDEAGKLVKSQDALYHREMRLIEKTKYNFTNEINIYDDKVAIISFADELIGMIIESHEIAETQRAIFQMVWEFADTNSQAKKDKNNLSLF